MATTVLLVHGIGFYIDINLTEWLTEKNSHLQQGLQTLVENKVITTEQAEQFGY